MFHRYFKGTNDNISWPRIKLVFRWFIIKQIDFWPNEFIIKNSLSKFCIGNMIPVEILLLMFALISAFFTLPCKWQKNVSLQFFFFFFSLCNSYPTTSYLYNEWSTCRILGLTRPQASFVFHWYKLHKLSSTNLCFLHELFNLWYGNILN